ncbi:MAG: hypothetical protein J2P47_16495 [Acetobacteraceae bacterium]|nr:hypothetical protein [Acetobacteraceae bacterium]
MELPVEGYPIGEEAVRAWFQHRRGREPSAEELGEILLAMTARDATPPVEAPGPGAAPDARTEGER